MENCSKTLIITPDQMRLEFLRILKTTGFSNVKAEKITEIFLTNSLEGVYSHGVNRFPRFVNNTKDGYIKPDAEPSVIHSSGSMEQWNGNLGPGPLNADLAATRAMEIAEKNGIGLVALANTNHWMRAGYYGRQAAKKGFILIAWTNTIANMPAWGAKDPRLGNNPFVIGVPYGSEAIVIDFAMTQFSYGKMETYSREKKLLPYPGGFDRSGKLTNNPDEILETWRTLPIGYWKGASFSLLLDILAVVLSGGRSTGEISDSKVEYGLSQVFIAIDIRHLHNSTSLNDAIRRIIDDLHRSIPVDENTMIRYPSENVARIREDSLKNGIPVNNKIWQEILNLNS